MVRQPETHQHRSSCSRNTLSSVMPGLVPGIHVVGRARLGVDGRDKPGHDEFGAAISCAIAAVVLSFGRDDVYG
jgi:hypothetical protein